MCHQHFMDHMFLIRPSLIHGLFLSSSSSYLYCLHAHNTLHTVYGSTGLIFHMMRVIVNYNLLAHACAHHKHSGKTLHLLCLNTS